MFNKKPLSGKNYDIKKKMLLAAFMHCLVFLGKLNLTTTEKGISFKRKKAIQTDFVNFRRGHHY